MSHVTSADQAIDAVRHDQGRRAARRDWRRYVRQARERLGTIARGC